MGVGEVEEGGGKAEEVWEVEDGVVEGVVVEEVVVEVVEDEGRVVMDVGEEDGGVTARRVEGMVDGEMVASLKVGRG